jgi:hypothetical protein
MKKNVEDYFNTLLKKVSKAEIEKNTVDCLKSKTMEEKREILLPIANFFYKMRNAGITVYPFEYLLQPLTKRMAMNPIPFKYFLPDSNEDIKYDLIHPSPLIVIKDPVKIEIGVINETFREDHGLISITCGKNHPDFEILSKNFNDVDEAIEAISEFFARNVISVERNH